MDVRDSHIPTSPSLFKEEEEKTKSRSYQECADEQRWTSDHGSGKLKCG
jgi:hypothetical protein